MIVIDCCGGAWQGSGWDLSMVGWDKMMFGMCQLSWMLVVRPVSCHGAWWNRAKVSNLVVGSVVGVCQSSCNDAPLMGGLEQQHP